MPLLCDPCAQPVPISGDVLGFDLSVTVLVDVLLKAAESLLPVRFMRFPLPAG